MHCHSEDTLCDQVCETMRDTHTFIETENMSQFPAPDVRESQVGQQPHLARQMCV
jgi:hypothetical protein